MLTRKRIDQVVGIINDWKRYYIAFNNAQYGHSNWHNPRWLTDNYVTEYVQLYRRALATGGTVALNELTVEQNERFIALMTSGECGVTALGLGIVLRIKGFEVQFCINKADSHAFLLVEGQLVDITGVHQLAIEGESIMFIEPKVLTLTEFSNHWVPHDLYGWVLLRYWLMRYKWAWGKFTLLHPDAPDSCMSPPTVHLGGSTLEDLERYFKAGELPKQIPYFEKE